MAKQVRPRIEQITFERLNQATVCAGADADSKINYLIDAKEKLVKEAKYQHDEAVALRDTILRQEQDHQAELGKVEFELIDQLETKTCENKYLARCLAVSLTAFIITLGFLAAAEGWI